MNWKEINYRNCVCLLRDLLATLVACGGPYCCCCCFYNWCVLLLCVLLLLLLLRMLRMLLRMRMRLLLLISLIMMMRLLRKVEGLRGLILKRDHGIWWRWGWWMMRCILHVAIVVTMRRPHDFIRLRAVWTRTGFRSIREGEVCGINNAIMSNERHGNLSLNKLLWTTIYINA